MIAEPDMYLTASFLPSEQGETLTAGILDARVRFYPSTTGGFFYDLRVSRNTTVTRFWNGFAMRNSNMDANVGQMGLALTLH